MDIILLEDIDKLGGKFEVVKVKDGYARNYLIPQKMALIANDTNMRRLDDYRARESRREEQMLSTYKEMAAKLEGQSLRIGAKAGTSGKIFGSVTSLQIANVLRDKFDIDIERRKIELPEEVKTLGEYTATIKFHRDVVTPVKFEVVQE